MPHCTSKGVTLGIKEMAHIEPHIWLEEKGRKFPPLTGCGMCSKKEEIREKRKEKMRRNGEKMKEKKKEDEKRNEKKKEKKMGNEIRKGKRKRGGEGKQNI